MKKLGYVICILVFAQCQNIKPETVSIPEYPDFEELLEKQIELLGAISVQKEVMLDGQHETQVIEMDSSKWANELFFLKEINPNQPRYIGAFNKIENIPNQKLILKDGEKGVLKMVSFSQEGSEYLKIGATFHEAKDVYTHHRDFKVYFKDGKINSFLIDGYQKMMFKDTIQFTIKVTAN
ncbi:hypothetical protein [Ekhidna sp.]